MKKVIIGDIDGCIIDSEHRIEHYIGGDLEKYHELHIHDTPMPACVAIYRAFLFDARYNFLFITGRDEVARDYTLKQLREYVWQGITNDQLLMRDRTRHGTMHDTELKPHLLHSVGYTLGDVLFAVDDRNSVVAEWRRLGVTCLQPQFGDF